MELGIGNFSTHKVVAMSLSWTVEHRYEVTSTPGSQPSSNEALSLSTRALLSLRQHFRQAVSASSMDHMAGVEDRRMLVAEVAVFFASKAMTNPSPHRRCLARGGSPLPLSVTVPSRPEISHLLACKAGLVTPPTKFGHLTFRLLQSTQSLINHLYRSKTKRYPP